MFYCETCNRRFRQYKSAAQHMNAQNHWVFGCEGCNKAFDSLGAACQHMSHKGHWGSHFTCESCDKEFQSPSAMDQHMTAVGHRETSFAHEMMRLDPGNKVYKDIKTIFDAKWYHDHKEAEFQGMYLNRRYAHIANAVPSGWRRLFHGTRRACRIGDSGNHLALCENEECSLCRILEDGFKLENAGSRLMFGEGIYTTSVSSKADNYAMNHHLHSRLHAILLCLVFVGTYEEVHNADHARTAPREGCHSVKAATTLDGGSVEYTETVVYNEASVIPIGMIMYTREGWGA